MKNTTTYEIIPHQSDPTRGSIQIIVSINDDPDLQHQYTVMSGPVEELRLFAVGEIDSAEVRRRWGRSTRGTWILAADKPDGVDFGPYDGDVT